MDKKLVFVTRHYKKGWLSKDFFFLISIGLFWSILIETQVKSLGNTFWELLSSRLHVLKIFHSFPRFLALFIAALRDAFLAPWVRQRRICRVTSRFLGGKWACVNGKMRQEGQKGRPDTGKTTPSCQVPPHICTGWSFWSRNTICLHQFRNAALLITSYTKVQPSFQYQQKVILDQMDHSVHEEASRRSRSYS